MEVFVEQPLALAGSAKKLVVSLPLQLQNRKIYSSWPDPGRKITKISWQDPSLKHCKKQLSLFSLSQSFLLCFSLSHLEFFLYEFSEHFNFGVLFKLDF